MAKQVDALQSFVHLADSIPQWLIRLDDLTDQVDKQFERFTKITRLGEVKLTRKKKQASTESLRPKDATNTTAPKDNRNGHDNQTDINILPQPSTQPDLSPTAQSNLFVQDRRKRRAGSDLSGAPSGPLRYRTKSMIVVYYDSAIQEAFEHLVRAIGSARNTLRKGKTSASFKIRMASLGMGPHKPSPGSITMNWSPKTMTPALARNRLGRDATGANGMRGFEEADRDLEEAQNLCERAAHQFLRDGDCRMEIDGTRKRFQSCSEITQREMERLKIEEQAEAAEEQKKREEEEVEAVHDIVLTTPPPPPMEENPVVEMKMGPSPLREICVVDTGAIEIDDKSDVESIHIDISAIRRAVRRV